MRTVGILTNGGDTCALNASIKSIRDNVYRAGYKKIYGIRRGYQGLIDGSIDDITHREIDVRIGGSCLGSLRTSPTDWVSEEKRHKISEERCLQMAECLSDYNIDVLVVIGGDGTLQSTRSFQTWVRQKHEEGGFREFEIIGFPKTIDNDIQTFTNFEGIPISLCPGFPSAVKKIVSCIEDLRVTVRTAERAFTVETMGRDAGWLAAAASFGGAEIVVLPEHVAIYGRKKDLNRQQSRESLEVSRRLMLDLTDQIEYFYRNNRNVLIAVGEGFDPCVKIKEYQDYKTLIEGLYGSRKKVGANELVAMLVSPALRYYFWCLSQLCGHKRKPDHVRANINKIIQISEKAASPEVRNLFGEYEKKVKRGDDHPLHEWIIRDHLLKALGVSAGDHGPSERSCDGSGNPCAHPGGSGNGAGDESEGSENGGASGPEEVRSPLTVPPYKFEIRPHRTDYLPRSGPPSSYDYKLATVLGQKVGEMVLDENRSFGAVPTLEQVVPYDQLSLDVVKTVQINEIETLRFENLKYFLDEEKLFQVSPRITNFFRTIMSGPESLDDAIEQTPTVRDESRK